VALPRAASGDDVTARYDAGVLTVTVGGVLAGPATHRVAVQTGAAPVVEGGEAGPEEGTEAAQA
jgi:hypothetical protein